MLNKIVCLLLLVTFARSPFLRSNLMELHKWMIAVFYVLKQNCQIEMIVLTWQEYHFVLLSYFRAFEVETLSSVYFKNVPKSI